MTDQTATTYDELLYTDNSFAETHPSHLAAVATLFGVDPPPLEKCRVLELGCGMGGNLIPMAYSLPTGTFLGIDLSVRQIAEGQKTVEALHLRNVDLRHQSILDFGADEGSFDYILCHGVYSWVPDSVREKILEILASHLAPTGIAYVSYNTYPGWHMRGMVRDIMRYHAEQFPTPGERVEQARAFLGFLSNAVSKHKSAYVQLLSDEIELLSDVPDTYLYHEHLEEHNDPVYFHQFASRVAEHNLQYLGESTIHNNWAAGFPPQVVEVLERISNDVIHAQQYLDFLRNTGFRRSLICRNEVTIDRDISSDRFAKLQVATHACPAEPDADIRSRDVLQFESRVGNLATDEPILKAAIVCLAEAWPQSLPFSQLAELARQRLGLPTESSDRDLEILQQAFLSTSRSAEIFEWRLAKNSFVTTLSDLPVACPLTRFKMTQGNRLTNRLHKTVEISDPVTRHVLFHLDGTRKATDIIDGLMQRAADGKLTMRNQNNDPITEPNELRIRLDQSVQQILDGLTKAAVIVA